MTKTNVFFISLNFWLINLHYYVYGQNREKTSIQRFFAKKKKKIFDKASPFGGEFNMFNEPNSSSRNYNKGVLTMKC